MVPISDNDKVLADVVSRSLTTDANGDKSETETTLHSSIYVDIQPWSGDVSQVPSGAVSNPDHMIFTETNQTDIQQYHIFVRSSDSAEFEVVFVYDYVGSRYYLARRIP